MTKKDDFYDKFKHVQCICVYATFQVDVSVNGLVVYWTNRVHTKPGDLCQADPDAGTTGWQHTNKHKLYKLH